MQTVILGIEYLITDAITQIFEKNGAFKEKIGQVIHVN